MGTLFATLLAAHVLLGLVGVIASFMVTYNLLKTELPLRFLQNAAWVAFVAYLLSWLSGGWYYWKWYGANVKPVILGGEFTWAHLIFMEAKEHVFLFLPFLTFVLALLLWNRGNTLIADNGLRAQTFWLSAVITSLAVIVTLSGVLITGGAR